MKKRLVGLMCMAVGLATALDAMGGLFISQYYEGLSNNKWIEIFNPGPEAVDLAAGEYWLGNWSNAGNQEGWKIGDAPSSKIALTNVIAAGATYLVKHNSAALPSYAVADQLGGTSVLGFNSNDTVVLYTQDPYVYANVVDAFGVVGGWAGDKSFVRKNTVTNGVNTDFNAPDWDEFTLTAVNEAGEGLNERLGYHCTGPSPSVTNVKFAVSSAIVDENQGEYFVKVVKCRPEGDVSGSIEISPFSTATLGEDYTLDTTNFTMNGGVTSAVFTVTILDDGDQEGPETITLTFAEVVGATLTTPISFTLTINPSDQPAYAIAIDPPVNGTVTTTPADAAQAGATVMINATPASGYVVDTYSVVGADTTVISTNSSFTMPAQAVTVTVTFKPFMGGPLFISEVADPDDNANARFVELYNAGTSNIDLAAGIWYLGRQANGTTWADIALTGTVGAAQTYIVAYQAATYASSYPDAPAPNQTSGNINGNGNDGYFLFRGGNHANGVLEDAYGVVDQDGTNPIVRAWVYLDTRAVRQAAVTGASPFWVEAEWIIPATATTADMTPGLHPDSLAVFAVSFDKADGFAVEAGTGGALTATAVRGTPPYGFAWSSSLAESAAEAGVFTILPTAPTGTYWAQVVATDSSEPVQAVTNTINFSVVPPPPKYPIAITPPTNGTVTTAPADQAAAGTYVSVYATPDGGWQVADIQVVDESSNPVPVTGITFLMPATGVTVTVLFEPYIAPDLVIDFETVTGFNSYAPGTSTVSGVTIVHSGALRGTTASDHFNGTASARVRYQAANAGFFANANAFAEPISRITFLYSDYGADITATFQVQVSADGTAWTDAGPVFDPASSNLAAGVLDTLPANMTYFRFLMNSGDEDDRVNIDDIGITFGVPVFAVGFDRPEGFAIEAGTADTITATAVNGTEPYGYAWSSTLDPAYYATNGNLFSILDTAPAGAWSATMVATDASEPAQTVTNTIGFHVIVKYAINIPAPVNGTVTTTPADEAAAGATVTIHAVPAVGYVVDTLTVVDAGMNPVTVTGKTFTMPASAVTVTVTFKPAETVGALILSQYYEGTGQNKWIEIFNPGAAAIDLATEGYRLGQFSNTNREGWKTGVPPNFTVVLSNSIAAGGTYLVANGSASNPVYAVANQVNGSLNFNGDDSVVLFKGAATAFSNVVDAFGTSAAFSNAAERSYVRTNTLTQGVNTDFNPAEWIEFTLAEVEGAAADANERLGYHSVSAGEDHPPIPPIVFVAQVGFTFTIPEPYTQVRVEGADSVNELTQAWNWTTLFPTDDYTFDGTTVTILTDPADKRMIRIWLQ